VPEHKVRVEDAAIFSHPLVQTIGSWGLRGKLAAWVELLGVERCDSQMVLQEFYAAERNVTAKDVYK
jgi:hypothetical protein